MIRKYAEIFCWKNVSSFCSAKATHIFSAKNFRKLYIESAKIVNEMALNELVKLRTLWTTRPRCPKFLVNKATCSDYPKICKFKEKQSRPWSNCSIRTQFQLSMFTLIWHNLIGQEPIHVIYTSINPQSRSLGTIFFVYFCLKWGFTAQSTQCGHVERGQFT